MSRFEREWHERHARERVAWGKWSASVRTRNLRDELRNAPPEKRKEIREQAEQENARGFWVG